MYRELPWNEETFYQKTLLTIPWVSRIERFHCITGSMLYILLSIFQHRYINHLLGSLQYWKGQIWHWADIHSRSCLQKSNNVCSWVCAHDIIMFKHNLTGFILSMIKPWTTLAIYLRYNNKVNLLRKADTTELNYLHRKPINWEKRKSCYTKQLQWSRLWSQCYFVSQSNLSVQSQVCSSMDELRHC